MSDVVERAQRFNEDAYLIAAGDPFLVRDLVATVEDLRVSLRVAQSTSYGLGEQLADIAEALGMGRDAEDLAITPRAVAAIKAFRELYSEATRLRNVVMDAAISQHREALKGMPDD